MEGHAWLHGRGGAHESLDAQRRASGRPSILLVEDDDDIRNLIVTLLEMAGIDTRACRSAEEGLERLRERSFDLVLTDYWLPRRSGGWLLNQAAAEGLLDATPALIVTAYPDPAGVDGFEVMGKPLDLDRLVQRVRRRLEAAGPPRRPRVREVPALPAGGGANAGCPDPIELILYVSAHSVHSANAIESVKAALSRLRASRVRLTVCDLSGERHKGSDGEAFTAALPKRVPGPRTFILGHITNPALVLELLEECEGS